MGVPSFFKWLSEKYKDVVKTRLERKSDKKLVLYFDFNGMIHPAVRSDPTLELKDMNAAVLKYLDDVLEAIRPDEYVICIDGVAPAAKMNQQRSRRYKSAKESRLMRELKIKHQLEVSEQQVDFNMISPGTEFMVSLQKFLNTQLKKRKVGPKWTLLGADVPGEGEHKIMELLRSRTEPEQSLIHGLDADLIFLSLLNAPDVTLVRENSVDPLVHPFMFLDVTRLARHLVHTLHPQTPFSEIPGYRPKHEDGDGRHKVDTSWYRERHRRLLTDYAYICFFLGNDFVPNVPSLSIRSGGLTEVLVAYKRTVRKSRDFLVAEDGCSVNLVILQLFFRELAAREQGVLEQILQQHRHSVGRNLRRIEAIVDPIEKERESMHFIEGTWRKDIRLGTPKWEKQYLKALFHISDENKRRYERLVDEVCAQYIRSTLWIIGYYLGTHRNWMHMYGYIAAPPLSELVRYLQHGRTDRVNNCFDDDKPSSPFVQLMSILPYESAGLLPKELGWYMTSKDSPIHWMYPVNVQHETFGKRFLHEVPVLVPPVDHALLETIVEAKLPVMSAGDRKRNT